MKQIKVKTPAKINLTLEILNKRSDGFHNIQSIMQTISLYDYLTFKMEPNNSLQIELSGNSKEIPYNQNNLVYKAASSFLKKSKIENIKLSIYIEKNVPVSAGLAGGSTNAAGTIFALNKLFGNILNETEINQLCASLGSDLNFCLKGGCAFCTSRGEITEKIPSVKQSISLIKPKHTGISTKEAYSKFDEIKDKTIPNNTLKLKDLILQEKFDKTLLYNSFEKALFPYCIELKTIKETVKDSLMTGSGSAFFVLEPKILTALDKTKYDIIENLYTINSGAEEIDE